MNKNILWFQNAKMVDNASLFLNAEAIELGSERKIAFNELMEVAQTYHKEEYPFGEFYCSSFIGIKKRFFFKAYLKGNDELGRRMPFLFLSEECNTTQETDKQKIKENLYEALDSANVEMEDESIELLESLFDKGQVVKRTIQDNKMEVLTVILVFISLLYIISCGKG